MLAPPIAKPKTSAAAPGKTAAPASRAPVKGQDDKSHAQNMFASWDLSTIPPMAMREDASDPLEREADRVAAQTLRMPDRNGAISITGVARHGNAAHPQPLHGGAPIPSPMRLFFERRIGHDFSDVRVHHGSEAARSAQALNARAYTYDRDIAFGAGQYRPGSADSAGLLAHELTHVVQQRGGRPQLQCSTLSDEINAAWKADPKIESLLARLAKDDVQSAQSDADIDAEIATALASKPDDLWLAQKIRKGELGRTAKGAGKPQGRPIEVTFFKGATDRRALVIAGVHGTERQGVDVARRLIDDLKNSPKPPGFTTIIVPSLFPDNEAAGRREGGTPTNRNFPSPSQDLADAKKAGGGTAKDALGKEILPENLMLMELMERFHPERIISIHGTWGPGAAGVSYDPRQLRPDEVNAARQEGDAAADLYEAGNPWEGGEFERGEKKNALRTQLRRQSFNAKAQNADNTDRDLSLRAAAQIDAATAAIPGREQRSMSRQSDMDTHPTKEQIEMRRKHPSIAGNIGTTGAIDTANWSGKMEKGVSLGGYAPARGISTFTVEPPVNANTKDYAKKTDDITQANRKIELQAYADAVRTVLLGAP